MTRFLSCLASVAATLGVSVSASGATPPGACPSTDRRAAVSARPGATRALVPPGARTILVCRYSGLGTPGGAFRLTVHQLVSDQATVVRLSRQLDALTPTTGVYHCPSDSGADVVARFVYPTGPQDPVTVDLTGCNGVTNGHVHREAGTSVAGRSLVGAFVRLTAHVAG